MKRKIICLLTALSLTAALSACGSGGQTPETKAPAPETTAPVSQEAGPYAFPAGSGGYAVTIDADMADVLAALGKEQSYFEAASCAFEGLDKTYTYAGFTITTRPEGEKDLVNSILLTDDSVTTAEGVYIGSPLAEVTAAYGDAQPADGVLSYTRDGVTLNFILENDAVISIEYLPG